MEAPRITGILTAALATTLLLGACGGSDEASPETTLDDVFAMTFASTSVREGDGERALASDMPITISFTEDGISATAGCNTLFGAATIDAGTLTIPGQLASTMMACDDALMAQDSWLAAFLASSPKIVRSGETLTLRSADTVIEFDVMDTAGMFDTPVFGPEELPKAQGLCDELLAQGATVEQARAAAENQGYIFRIASQDGESFPTASDSNPGRIRIDVVDDVVIGCVAG